MNRTIPLLALLLTSSPGWSLPGGADQGYQLARSLQPGELVAASPGIQLGSVSPDGTRVAYLSREPTPRIEVAPRTGGGSRTLVEESGRLGGLVWAPGGQWLYFHSDRLGAEKIFRVRVGDGKLEQVTSGEGHDLHPTLSADGRTLAFDSDRSGGYDIWTRDLVTQEETRVTMARGPDFYPTLHPDGTRVAFTSRRDGRWRIWAKPLRGGAAYPLSPGKGADSHAAASPDGTWVAFDSDRDGDASLWVVPWTGGEARKVNTPFPRATYPSFHQQGRALAFTAGGSGLASLQSVTLGDWVGEGSGRRAPVASLPGEVPGVPAASSGAFSPSSGPVSGSPERIRTSAPGSSGFQVPPVPGAPARDDALAAIPVPGALAPGAEPVRVLSFQPTSGERKVSPDAPVFAAFSLDVRAPQGWERAVQLAAKGQGELAVQVVYNAALRRLEITPVEPLEGGTTYRIRLRKGALVGPEGEPFEGFQWLFRTKEGAVSRRRAETPRVFEGPFRLRTVRPKPGQNSVRPDVKLAMRFSRPFDPGTLSASSLTLRDDRGQTYPGEIRLGRNDQVLAFVPYEPLTPGGRYQVVLDRGLTGDDGGALTGPDRWIFTVAHDSPLEVVEIEPKDGLLEAETTLTLVFNRPVDRRTLEAGEIRLEGGGMPHAGSHGLDSSGKVLLFQPFARLPPRTRFVLHLPPGLADQDGNGLKLESPLTFRTKGAPEGDQAGQTLARYRAPAPETGGEPPSLAGYLGTGRPTPSAYLSNAGSTGSSVPGWVPKVLRVMKRKGYLDPALESSLDTPGGLTRFKAALLVDSARQRGAAMTSHERKIVEKLAQEFQGEMAQLGRGGSVAGEGLGAL